MTREELKEILIKHQMWFNSEEGGKCADFYKMDFYGISLQGVNLSGANLSCANLSCVNLQGANLSCANLSGANLSYAFLWSANLDYANLNGANLRGADLRDVSLICADLQDVDLSGASLSGANLNGVYINNTKGNLLEYRRGKILRESIIGYKKCKDNIIVKLEIPKGAIVFSINGNKCRTNKVIVKEIYGANRTYSIYGMMSYYVGDEITVNNFNCQYNVECDTGIHFFMTRKEAEEYEL